MRTIDAAILDRYLANLSDEPQVQRDYDPGGRGVGDRCLAIFWGESGDGPVYDYGAFLLAAVSHGDTELARDLHDSLYLDRPSYRGDWYCFQGFTLSGTFSDDVSRYEVDDNGDKVTCLADLKADA